MSTPTKLEPKWRGPLQVLGRTGRRSYLVIDKRGIQLPVHVDQMKPYYPLLGEDTELEGLPGSGKEIEKILGCKEGTQGNMEYLVIWKNDPNKEGEWLTYDNLLTLGHAAQVDQCHQQLIPR